MTTSNTQLEHLAKKNNIKLNAILSKDMLPINVEAGGYIINLQSSYEGEGTHWVSLFVENDKKQKHDAVYFDSFGFIFPLEVSRIRNIKKPIAYLNEQIQNIRSAYCGQYCLLFLWYMGKSKKPILQRFGDFIHLFREDEEENLRLLKKYLKDI